MMKTLMSLTVLVAVSLAAVDDSQDDAVKKIRQLRKERVTTLKLLVDSTTAQHDENPSSTSLHEVREAQLALLNAELEAAETDPERIAILEKTVDLLKSVESMLDASVKARVIAPKEYFAAKAERLKAEIALEYAKKELHK